jgi:hypothetical protein
MIFPFYNAINEALFEFHRTSASLNTSLLLIEKPECGNSVEIKIYNFISSVRGERKIALLNSTINKHVLA